MGGIDDEEEWNWLVEVAEVEEQVDDEGPEASFRDEPFLEWMDLSRNGCGEKNELLLVLWQLSMSGFSLKLFVCYSISVMMFVVSYMHDYACYVSCILVHSLYQLIQTNLTWAAQC